VRTFLALSALLLTLGCPASPQASPEPARPTATPAPPPSPPPPQASEAPSDGPVRAGPLPAGRVPDTAVSVAIVGYGIRLDLRPPFQAVRMGGMLEGLGPDGLVVSWWDTTAKGAGKSGDIGLYNAIVFPVAETPAGASVQVITEGDPAETRLRLGDAGTEVRLPAGATALGGMGTLQAGPTHTEWRLVVAGETVVFPPGPMLHSADPAEGTPIAFLDPPTRPWGAWPE